MFNVKLKPVVLAVAGVLVSTSVYAADAIKADKVDVISATPLQGIGISLNKVPSNVQIVKDDEFKKQQSISIADYMINNLQGVSVVESQNNPFQPDVWFRGFTASPLLGTPQGLSVYLDGVRVNESFGDVVNWDLIPMNAIAGMQLIPGTNPVYGLNTLGGALSLQTKSGRTHQGVGAEVSAGSWGRKTGSAEIGGVSKDGSVDYFFSANMFSEDGWRDHSPTDVRQAFAKVGWQNEKSKIDLSYTGANNDMVGNGMSPKGMLDTLGRKTIYTKPDQTKNQLSHFNLTGSHWFSDDVMFSGNTYYRHLTTKTKNGDTSETFDEDEFFTSGPGGTAGTCTQAGYTDIDVCAANLNTSKTRQSSYGLNGQLVFNQDLAGKKNQLTVGASFDKSRVDFESDKEYGQFDASRGVVSYGFHKISRGVDRYKIRLHGDTQTSSLFATDTLSLNDFWHVTMSGRYNYVDVENNDKMIAAGTTGSLSGNHTFNRFNPAVGLNFTPTENLTVYGTYNEGSRAPTSMELGCADPLNTCKLPNAMAGDPPLKQVVVKTFEAGARGKFADTLGWSLAAYRSENQDDIHFIASSTQGRGYFKNVGETRRAGLDAGLNGAEGNFKWNLSYSYVDATYESDLDIISAANSNANGLGVINVKKGNRLADIPKHQFKARLEYSVTPDWIVGSNVVAFSDRYMRGNENNSHVDNGNGIGNGKISGYAIVNLDTRYKLGNGWSVFGKAINIFDREYNTTGMLGDSMFNSNGVWGANEIQTGFFAPGAPRAGWLGVRYDFDGAK